MVKRYTKRKTASESELPQCGLNWVLKKQIAEGSKGDEAARERLVQAWKDK